LKLDEGIVRVNVSGLMVEKSLSGHSMMIRSRRSL
jgi:hypothetical protein